LFTFVFNTALHSNCISHATTEVDRSSFLCSLGLFRFSSQVLFVFTSRVCMTGFVSPLLVCSQRISQYRWLIDLRVFVVKLFSNRHCYSLSVILLKPGTHYLCANMQQEAQLSLTNRAMPICKVVEVLQDLLSEYVGKFTRDYNVILYLSIFNSLRVIQCVSPKISIFTTFSIEHWYSLYKRRRFAN